MKSILKFLILSLGLVAAQGVMAVTLPSQSYDPYAIDPTMADESIYVYSTGYGVSMPSESFSSLRADESDWGSKCIQSSSENLMACQNCCYGLLAAVCPNPSLCSEEYLNLYHACANDCGRSLPLDGGLYLILALAVAFGAAKALMLHKKSGVELSLQCCNA